MNIDNIGDVIAVRKFNLQKDKKKEIYVVIGKPQQFSDSTDYYCPFQIKGIGSEKIKFAGGVDAVQAIQLVIKMIGIDLHVLNQTLGGTLRWDASDNDDLGFPFE